MEWADYLHASTLNLVFISFAMTLAIYQFPNWLSFDEFDLH